MRATSISYRSAGALVLSLLLVTSLFATVVAAEAIDDPGDATTDLGASHPLASNASVDEFEREGYTSSELTRYQIRLSAAEDGEDVGLDPSMARDLRSDYVRIQYNETATRTVRILLPRDMITPYTMTSVDSLTTDHVASYEPARNGEYLSITLRFDEPADVVLPLQKDTAAGSSIIERADRRIEQLSGISPLGRDGEWMYVDGEEVAGEAAYPVNASADDLLIQYDARPEEPEDVWLNAPETQSGDAPVYYFERGADEQVYIVSTAETNDTAPDIRIRENASRADRVRGDLNDLRLVPDRIRDRLGGGVPFLQADPMTMLRIGGAH